MAISVRLDPVLETRLEQEARRRGVSKSDVIKDALDRVLGTTNPYQLLQQVRHAPAYEAREPSTALSENAGERLKALLSAKHPD
ncbi:MAG: ribbon-helix-helix protein, CopG family [Rhodocyclaceae bacterium]|nr:ribbon-helix-helix protein, CopG family [Rhodocyclaceae bacterium]